MEKRKLEIIYCECKPDKNDKYFLTWCKIKTECSKCGYYNILKIHHNQTQNFGSCLLCGESLSINYIDLRKKLKKYLLNREKYLKMDLKIEKGLDIKDGLHEGEILDVKESSYEKGDNKFSYLDIYISVDDFETKDGDAFKLKAGFPLPPTTNSALGKFLLRFGLWKKAGDEIKDIETKLIGLPVCYLTMKKTGKDNNEYVNIVNDSIKLRE